MWKENFLYEVIEKQTRKLKLPFRPLHCKERDEAAGLGVGRDDDD